MRSVYSKCRLALIAIVEASVTNIPGGLGRTIRRAYWRRRLKHMGVGVHIDIGVRIINPQYVSIGDNAWIDNYVIILAGPHVSRGGPIYVKRNADFIGAPGEVVIGSNAHIANFVVLQGHGGVLIGNDVTIASGSKLYSMSHHHSNMSDRLDSRKFKFSSLAPGEEQSLILGAIVVCSEAAVGLNSILLPGVCVGRGSWVAAGSVLSWSIPDNVLVAGNPAVVVKPQLHPGWVPEVKPNG